MGVIADIIGDESSHREAAVAAVREHMQYRMFLAGETLLESVKSLRSLTASMRRCEVAPFFVEMIELQAEFVEKRANRLKAGE